MLVEKIKFRFRASQFWMKLKESLIAFEISQRIDVDDRFSSPFCHRYESILKVFLSKAEVEHFVEPIMMNFGLFSSGSRNSLCFLFSPVADVGTLNLASLDFNLVFGFLIYSDLE